MNRESDAARPWAAKRQAPERPIVAFARANRLIPTDAERVLRRKLRSLDVKNTHFRRQVVMGRHIADFACRKAKPVIEIDGGQHCESAADARRTACLEAAGWRVIRSWNSEVPTNPEGVFLVLTEALRIGGDASSGTTPTRGPSARGGGEKNA